MTVIYAVDAQGDVVNECGAVLKAGVYNTASYRSSSANALKSHQSSCSNFESETYDEYRLLTSSSTAKGWAYNFNVGASYMGIGGKASGSGSSYYNDASKFSTAMAQFRSYQAALCKNSSINSASDSRINTLATFIDPRVHDAYKQCLALQESGIQITQTEGFQSKSITIDMLWNPPSGFAEAKLTGLFVYPAGAATCKMYAYNGLVASTGGTGRRLLWEGEPEGLYQSVSSAAADVAAFAASAGGRRRLRQSGDPFYTSLTGNVFYTIFCKVTSSAPKNNFTEVFISTTVSGSYRALMFNTEANQELKRIGAMEERVQTWYDKLKPSTTGSMISPDKICIGEHCLGKSGSSVLISNRMTGYVRADINFDPLAADRFKVYVSPGPTPNDTAFYVNSLEQFGYKSAAAPLVPAMSVLVDKLCVQNDVDCITRVKPWIKGAVSSGVTSDTEVNPVALDRHNIRCMPGAFLSSVRPASPWIDSFADTAYGVSCAYFCGTGITKDNGICYTPDAPKH